jgi:hypothetical protein
MAGRLDTQLGVYDSPEVENKTNKKSNNTDTKQDKASAKTQDSIRQLGQKNVLNGYRSITYNFTLSGLRKAAVDNLAEYRNSELDLVILKSGGKGTAGILPPDPVNSPVYDKNDAKVKRINEDVYDKNDAKVKRINEETSQGITTGFNNQSPGRFDMFIDNLEFDAAMAFTENSNTSLPTGVKFDVVEPYSVNGFLEALHVSSLSAGYPSYLQASFLLKMEFWGYPDAISFSEPELIPNSTRYFSIGITNVEIDISEKGTRYRVSAVPFNQRAFGEPNTLKKPVKMKGTTVKEILEDLMKSVNEQVARYDKDGNETNNGSNHNRYFVKFPTWVDGKWNYDVDNKIAGKKLIELYRDNALYNMVDPATVTPPNAYKAVQSNQPSPASRSAKPESIKYTPNKTVVQFPENQKLHDIISAVIRDSEYVRGILENIKASIDSEGNIEYFNININVKNRDVIDDLSKKPFQDYTFLVTPFKIHYTRIPGYGNEKISEKQLSKVSLKEYNYIYTGENVDVLSFRLNFNNLYFEAAPAAMGNRDVPSRRTGAASTNDPAVKLRSSSTSDASQQIPTQAIKVAPTSSYNSNGSAAQPLDTPYAVLARNMHDAIINANSSAITGELEILGDPFYVTAGGISNNAPSANNIRVNQDGSVASGVGDLLITLNFRNPIDIGLDGMMKFDPNRVPFSGVYRVTKVVSTFKEGTFKQRLEIMRVPGQVLDADITPSDPNDRIITKPEPDDQQSPSITNAPSYRADSATVFQQLGRGLPSPGLPGQQSNFTNAVGGLGGSSAVLSNQTLGAATRSALAANSSVIGKSLPRDLSSSIRLNTSGLVNLAQTGLSTAALVAVAANVVTGNVPSKRALGVIAGAAIGGALSRAIVIPNVGSGIGAGKTVSITNTPGFTPATLPSNSFSAIGKELTLTAKNAVSQLETEVGNFTKNINDLSSTALSAVTQLGTEASDFANDIGKKVNKLLATPADPAGIAATVGIDAAKLSGLGNKLASKVDSQVNDIIKNIPANVDLAQAAAAGLAVDYLSAASIKNLPASQLFSVAPAPLLSISKLSSIEFNPLSTLRSAGNAVDLASIKGKYASASTQLRSALGIPNIIDRASAGSVAQKFGSISAGQSPLDKLVNNVLNDPNASPYTGTDPIIRRRLGLPPL